MRVFPLLLTIIALVTGCAAPPDTHTVSKSMSKLPWSWPDSIDAVVAAPESHRILLENDSVRVVEVLIAPGEQEPVHTHRWPSVMLVDRAARIRYYGEDGTLVFESPERWKGEPVEQFPARTEWMEPEGPHAVENIDEVIYHAIRIELKGG